MNAPTPVNASDMVEAVTMQLSQVSRMHMEAHALAKAALARVAALEAENAAMKLRLGPGDAQP